MRAAFILGLPFLGLILVAGLLASGISLSPLLPALERQISATLDRPVSFDGDVRIALGRTITLDVSGFRIANAPWGEATPYLTADDFHVAVDALSLVRGPLLVRNLRTAGISLNRETDELGRSNKLSFGGEEDDEAKESSFSDLIIESAEIRDIDIRDVDRQNGEEVRFSVHAMTQQSASASGLHLEADGHLQEEAWTVIIDATAQQSRAPDAPFEARMAGTLAGMTFDGEMYLPILASLHDLTLRAHASGTLPREITKLSPLLREDTPLNLDLTARDIDPGIALELDLTLPNVAVHITGDVHRPQEGDGLALNVTADAASVKPLAQALDLGEVDELPLLLSGRVQRDGNRIELDALRLTIGEHALTGNVLFPNFPRTAGSLVELEAHGPDFAFYQRLLKRPVSFPLPYRAKALLREGSSGAEVVDSLFRIGDHELSVEGALGDFPSYRNSDLRFRLRGPDTEALGDAFGVTLPQLPYSADGRIAVDGEQNIVLHGFNLEAATLAANARGRIDGHPEFDDLDLALVVTASSLAQSSTAWGLETLGNVPARIEAHLAGGLRELTLSQVKGEAGGLTLRSVEGALKVTPEDFATDLVFAASVTDIAALLGAYADSRLPQGTYSMTLAPRINETTIDLALAEISGPGVRGRAEVRINRNFSLDENTQVSADLRVDTPALLLPVIDGYEAPANPIALTATTEQRGANTQISARLTGAGALTLDLVAAIPSDNSAPVTVTLRGEGQDLRSLGHVDAMPEGALPFTVDSDLRLQGDTITAALRHLEIAGTSVIGDLRADMAARDITASLRIPQADLQRWIAEDSDGEGGAETSPASDDGRMIPDVALPVEWLNRYRTDISLDTGPLGIADPGDPSRSLVDRLQMTLRSGQGKAELDLKELQGSRGSASGQLQLSSTNGTTVAGLTLRLRDLPVGSQVASRGLDALPPVAVDADLNAQGDSTRELAATLTGTTLLTASAGRLQNMQLGLATESFLDQLFRTLLPTIEENNDLEVECSVLAARARDGVIALEPGLVLRSKRVDLTASGEINLATESIRIRFANQARRGLGISAAGLVNPFVQITGTLSAPRLSLDVTNTAVEGGVAAATGGLSIVAKTFYKRFLDQKDPCEAALASWQELTAGER